MTIVESVVVIRVWTFKFKKTWEIYVGHSSAAFPIGINYKTKREAMKALRHIRREFERLSVSKMDIEPHEQSDEYKILCMFRHCAKNILAAK